jgi:CRISPR-associated endonuclease/helicase Cas3
MQQHAPSAPAGQEGVYWAHSKNTFGQRQGMEEHLAAVAAEAGAFAAPFGAAELAHYLGLWHDVGKYHADFQTYLRQAEQDPRVRGGPDHKAAGARIALEQGLDPLMLVLQGHHGGLHDLPELRVWYKRKQDATAAAIAVARQRVPGLFPQARLNFPAHAANPRTTACEFFLRMLFSALVDADFLDTERHFSPARAEQRGAVLGIAELWTRFEAFKAAQTVDSATVVNQARAEIYAACLAAALLPPGFFRLSVPTGGGKTISGMGFALRHALAHGLRRVVVAVPYLTITQQTADVYRGIFAREDDAVAPVLEHHSAAGETTPDGDEYDPAEVRRRLAAENWDAPVVVTTTVQLFESLFANGTSRCRKLHRLAGSVILLDEAQTLPPHLLDPILDVLQELCTHYGASVVLSTATQPAYEAVPIFSRVQAREIVPEPQRYFATLKRVRYDWQYETGVTWEEVAGWLRAEQQALCIVNTKQDALDLLGALGDPDALHLSTLLCGQHRRQVIAAVKQRLQEGVPCRLVTTQVVEAGVDLDFPVVLRALAPLPSIVQAAGRANREGKLPFGRVIVFRPQEERLPGADYKRATQVGGIVLRKGYEDLNNPATIREYFTTLYQMENTDGKGIQSMRRGLSYPETARTFRLIDDNTFTVVVPYGSEEEQAQVEQVWAAVETRSGNLRELLRRLQPYTVALYAHQAKRYLAEGWIQPSVVLPDLGRWLGGYDAVRGLVAELAADQLVF